MSGDNLFKDPPDSLLSLAVWYWKSYFYSVGIALLGTVILSGLGIIATLLWFPEATPYLILAVLGWVVHYSAIFFREVSAGNFDPERAMDQTMQEWVVLTFLVSLYYGGLVFVATIGAYLISPSATASYAAVGFALLYPAYELVSITKQIPAPLSTLFEFVFRGLQRTGTFPGISPANLPFWAPRDRTRKAG